MTTNEKDRLDLRQELERLFSNPRFADIAMEAMPPIDYAQLATKRDLDTLEAKIDGGLAQVRGEIAELSGSLRSEMSSNLRLMFAMQLTTTMMLGAWVAAVT